MRDALGSIAPYRNSILLGLLALVILVVGFDLFGNQPPKEFTIATGREGGAYYTYAQQYQQRFAELGYTLNIRETAGGIETIQLLESGEVDAGFVQNTVIASNPETGLTTLSAIFYEPLWIFVRDDLEAQPANVAELSGLRINIGEEGSATNQAVGGLLGLNGVTQDNATLSSLPLAEAADQLAAGDLDVVLMFSGASSPEIATIMATPNVRLLPIMRAQAYADRFKNLFKVMLSEGAIDLANNLPPEDTPMIATKATLVAGPSLHPDLARLLLIVASEVHQGGGFFEQPNEFPSAVFVGIPMNLDATRYLENGPTFLEKYLPLWLASRLERILLIALPAFLILYPIMRALPSLYGQGIERRIKSRYRQLFEIEGGYLHYDMAQLDEAIAELERWQAELTDKVDVPVMHMDELYNFRMHIEYALNRLNARKAVLAKEAADKDEGTVA